MRASRKLTIPSLLEQVARKRIAAPAAPLGTTSSGPTDWGIVTSLPAGAAVGDVCRYLADKTNGILWDFVYTGEGTYPWSRIGGDWLLARVAGLGERTNAAYGDCTAGVTAGPEVVTPLKGDYIVRHGCQAQVLNGPSSNAYVSVSIGAAAALDEDSAYLIAIDQFEGGTLHSGPIPKAGLAAGTAIRQRYKGLTETRLWKYERRWVEIRPRRVG